MKQIINNIFSKWLSPKPNIKNTDSKVPAEESHNAEFNFFLYTDNAQNMMRGRKGDRSENIYPITGFFGYAKNIIAIWDDAKGEYPYARWWLITIADMQLMYRDELTTKENKLYELIEGDKEDFAKELQKKITPKGYDIVVKNPYATNQIKLISRYDEYLQIAYKLKESGIISSKDFFKDTNYFRKRLAAIHNQSRLYHPIPVTRKDIYEKTDLYYEALDKMGEIPENIFRNRRIPPYFQKKKL